MLYNIRVACFGVYHTTPDPYRKFACQFEFDATKDVQIDRTQCYKFNTIEKIGNALITPAEKTLKNAQDPDKDAFDNPLMQTVFLVATLFTAPIALVGAGVKRLGECFNRNAKIRRLALAKLIKIRSMVSPFGNEKLVPLAMVSQIFVHPITNQDQKEFLKSNRSFLAQTSSDKLQLSIFPVLAEIKEVFFEKILKGQKGISQIDLDEIGVGAKKDFISLYYPPIFYQPDDKTKRLTKIFNEDIKPFQDIWINVYLKAFKIEEVTSQDMAVLCNGNPDMQAVADKWKNGLNAMEQRKIEVLRLCDDYNQIVHKLK